MKWWQDKIIYQIYPKSFFDSNDDGIGDIPGITSKLDYLKDLGVDILWLTPCFASPMKDNGYDVSDYRLINPIFGTNEDMDNLIKEAKKRDMCIMLDIVANHTSNEHEWFKQALKGKDNPYRDYYIFKDEPLPAIDSVFGGSAWEYEPKSKQYYLHQFAVSQPDLNTANPAVRKEITDIINYWIDKGIKGFRFDVIHLIGKEVDKGIFGYGPKLHQYVREMNEASFGKRDVVTVGEAWGDLSNAIDFTDSARHELDMVFQFEVTTLSWGEHPYGKMGFHKPDMEKYKYIFAKYQNGLKDKGWNSLFLENHDSGRCIDVYGDINYRYESATSLAASLYLQKGTPFIYQGQEIGLTNTKMELDEYDDVETFGLYDSLVKTGLLTKEQFMDALYKNGRDNARIPIPWDDSLNGGFNKGHQTWIKVHPDISRINVKKEVENPHSVFNFYKKLIALRKGKYKDLFVNGDFELIYPEIKDLFAYKRIYKNQSIYIFSNLSSDHKRVGLLSPVKEVLLSNLDKKYKGINVLELDPYETVTFSM